MPTDPTPAHAVAPLLRAIAAARLALLHLEAQRQTVVPLGLVTGCWPEAEIAELGRLLAELGADLRPPPAPAAIRAGIDSATWELVVAGRVSLSVDVARGVIRRGCWDWHTPGAQRARAELRALGWRTVPHGPCTVRWVRR